MHGSDARALLAHLPPLSTGPTPTVGGKCLPTPWHSQETQEHTAAATHRHCTGPRRCTGHRRCTGAAGHRRCTGPRPWRCTWGGIQPLALTCPLPNQIDTTRCTESTDPEVAHRTATTSLTSLPTGRTGGPRAGGARAGHWAVAHRVGPSLPTGRTRRPRGGARAAGHWAVHRGGPCQEVCRRRTTGRVKTTSRATGRLATATPATTATPVAAMDVAKLWEAPERSHQADHDVPGVLHTPSGHHQALDLAGGCWHSVTRDVDAYT